MVELSDLNKHDTVVVMENGGHYRADFLGTMTRDDGQELASVQVIYILEEPSYDLENGDTCNVYPDDIVKVKN